MAVVAVIHVQFTSDRLKLADSWGLLTPAAPTSVNH